MNRLTMKTLEWEDVPDEIIGKCIKQIIKDSLQISKKMLKSALECFYNIKVVEEEK